MMRILIVEDDPFISDDLLNVISSLFPNGEAEIIGPVDTYSRAMGLLNTLKLDIALGEDTNAGIRLAQYINQSNPQKEKHFHLPIPRNNDSKKMLYLRLGMDF